MLPDEFSVGYIWLSMRLTYTIHTCTSIARRALSQHTWLLHMDSLDECPLLWGKILRLLLAEDTSDFHGGGGVAQQGEHTHLTRRGLSLVNLTCITEQINISIWVRLSMTQYDSVWLSMTQYGSVRLSMTQYDSVRLSMTQYDSVWLRMTQYGSVWLSTCTCMTHDSVWLIRQEYDSVWLVWLSTTQYGRA